MILLFWTVLGTFVRVDVATGLLRAGVVMALLYAVVRGVGLARTAPATPQPRDVRALLRENARVALPAGAWFLAAHLTYVVAGLWDAFRLPGLFTSPADEFAFVFVGTGVATVLLYPWRSDCPGYARARRTSGTGRRRPLPRTTDPRSPCEGPRTGHPPP